LNRAHERVQESVVVHPEQAVLPLDDETGRDLPRLLRDDSELCLAPVGAVGEIVFAEPEALDRFETVRIVSHDVFL
jgi:hypothetical protein